MLFRFLLSFLLLQVQPAQAQNKIWLRAYNSSLEDFNVFLASSSRKSYAQFQLESLRKQTQKFQLKEKLIEAQKRYLEGKHKKAIHFFNQIIKEAYSADWSQEERRIILYAFLRSAQIQEEKTQAFLILARNFKGQALSKDNYRDFNLFPPPLISELEKIQDKNSVLYPNWNTLFPHHEILLLNGQKIEKNQSAPFLAVRYRVTALSSSHRAWSQTIDLSQLVLKPIQTERLSSGLCEKVKLIPELENKFYLFSQAKCKTSQDLVLGIKTQDLNKPNLELNQELSLKEWDKTTPKEEEPDKKRSQLATWLVVGAGIITLSLFISLAGNKNEPEEEGYIY